MALSRPLLIGLVLALVIAIVLIGVYYYVSSSVNALRQSLIPKNTTPTGPIEGSAFLTNSTVLSYNNSRSFVEYSKVHYGFLDTLKGTATLSVYSTNPIRTIYLVNVGASCFDCLGSNPGYENELYQNLTRYLNQYGLIRNSSSIQYINLTNGPGLVSIATVPGNAIVIIPSGLIPCILMPGLSCTFGTSSGIPRTDLIQLLNKGDTIIYIGDDFSKAEDSGIIVTNKTANYQSSMQVLANAGIVTNQTRSGGASYIFHFNTPSFAFKQGQLFGPLSYIHAENGTLIAFSNTSVNSWPDISSMAQDISTAIYSRFWLTLLTRSSPFNITAAGTTPVFTIQMPLKNSSNVNNMFNNSYSTMDLRFVNSTSFANFEIPFRVRFQNNGTLGVPSVIGVGQSIPLSVIVGNVPATFKSSPVSNTSILFSIDIYNSTFGYISSIHIGNVNTPPISIIKPWSFTDLAPGYYIASLTDLTPRTYEDAIFYVPYLNVTPISLDFKNGTFLFNVINNNQSVTGVPFQALFNGGDSEPGTITNGVLNYTLPRGSVIKYGNQTIEFNILGINYSVKANFQKPPQTGIPAIYIEFAIAAFGILILNLIIKAPNRDDYYIDVPVFPHLEKVNIKTSQDAVLNLFDTINEHYRWRYMPLTVEEVKAGISSNIRYGNVPIMITLENTSEILYRLANEGKIEVVEPYFMPKRWEDASHHDIEYLVIFRKLRDFAVTNAVLFTDIYTAEEADMVITSRGMQSYLYIYSKASKIRDVKITKDGRTFIVFLDKETKQDFLEKLYSTYGEQAVLLRMGIEEGSIQLIDTNNLKPLIY